MVVYVMKCCSILWYGMVWYGMVWYGMAWYGMVWYGTVWYGMVWNGLVWNEMVWGGTGRFDEVWYGASSERSLLSFNIGVMQL